MKLKNIGSGVTGDNVDPTTMEHRNIRPVAWAKEQFCLRKKLKLALGREPKPEKME
ncbi:hypothetical protein IAE55_30270 [Paenibacillus sp. S28]|nr:hypothetical protein [Paenibacillus sp. S28]